MKKLLLLLFFIPNLVMSGGMGGSKESVPGVNPFELLKEINEAKPRNKPKETTQTKEVTKLIFPSDIEGAEEIYEVPKLERFAGYGDKKLYHLIDEEFVVATSNIHSSEITSYIVHNSPDDKIFDIQKSCSEPDSAWPRLKQSKNCLDQQWTGTAGRDCSVYAGGGGYDPDAEEIIEKTLEQPSQTDNNYKTNTQYRFIKKIDKSVIFAKDSKQLDHKLDPKLNGLGELIINLEASYSVKKYFETPLYVTFSASANKSCVKRSIDNYWYDPNELKLIKEQPESKIQNTEEDKITPVDDIAITFDGINDSYYDGYNLHERLIASSLNNSEIKVFCSSCKEQKDYSIKVDLAAYKKNFAAELKAQGKIDFDQSVAPFKSQCEAIGFKPGTDKFKNCLVEMMN